MKSTEVRYIKLCKIKQWYFPTDAESYNLLKDANFPLIRFHQNMLPTVALACKPRNIKAKNVNFKDEILNPFLDKLGVAWQSKDYRKALITSTTMTFDSLKELKLSKVVVEKLDACLRRFFARWGYTFTINYSELREKCKLHVVYKFDSNKLPVLPLVSQDLSTVPILKFKLGYLRINLQLGVKYVEIFIEEKMGNAWLQIKASRCLYSEIGDVRPMLNALTNVVNKEQHNFELPNE